MRPPIVAARDRAVGAAGGVVVLDEPPDLLGVLGPRGAADCVGTAARIGYDGLSAFADDRRRQPNDGRGAFADADDRRRSQSPSARCGPNDVTEIASRACGGCLCLVSRTPRVAWHALKAVTDAAKKMAHFES